MYKIKVFVNKHTTEEGVEFFTANAGGTYLPLADALEGVNYTIRPTSKSAMSEYWHEEGVYEIGYQTSKDIWIDKREDFIEKHIVRINAARIVRVGDIERTEQAEEIKDEDIPF